MSDLTLVAAVADNGVIGPISWDLPGDRRRFKALTMGKYVIFGRKTAETVPKLKGREVLVASGNDLWSLVTYALTRSEVEGRGEVIVGGGAQIYKALWPCVTKAVITKVHMQPEGDVFFPECPCPDAWVWKDFDLNEEASLSIGVRVQ